jgi:hypothetical protein
MSKLLRMMAMVGAFVTLQVAGPRTQVDLHCTLVVDGCSVGSPYNEITCTWDVEDDCADQEPAYDLCQDTCIECPSGGVDFSRTGGWACDVFECICLPW